MTDGQKFLEQHKAQLLELCRRYPVERLYLFGSVMTDEFDPGTSDVDAQVFFVDMVDRIERGRLKWLFWNDLESILGRRVDLLTEKPLKNAIFRNQVETSRQLIYDRKSEKILA